MRTLKSSRLRSCHILLRLDIAVCAEILTCRGKKLRKPFLWRCLNFLVSSNLSGAWRASSILELANFRILARCK
jgi:hypothetical protein